MRILRKEMEKLIGEKNSISVVVDETMLASAVGSGLLDVFATPKMIQLMEQAASELIQPALEEGEASVGTALHIEHTAPTPLGMTVIVTAELVAAEGRRRDFEVIAADETGEIGKGTHSRFVVSGKRFMEKATGKKSVAVPGPKEPKYTKRLAIFDLDGTLLDTLDDLAAASNHALEVCGLPPHPVAAFRMFVGNGAAKLIERMTPAELHTPELLRRLRAEFDAYYSAHGGELTVPFNGIPQMLNKLESLGVTMVVLSNKPHQFVETFVPDYFGKRFTIVYGQREGFPMKPDKALIEDILEKTGIPADNSVYLGDSGVDMQTARNGKIKAIGALWGYRDRAELEQNGADAVISHPLQFLQYFF